MNKILGSLSAWVLIFFISCDPNRLVDETHAIQNHNWFYKDRVQVRADIKDINKRYNVYLNLRHTSNYKYANIFVMIYMSGSDKTQSKERKEFSLAYPDGEWKGKGTGNLYSYNLLLRKDMKFPKAGKYTFTIEQNMRDNPLREVSDIGLRIEEAK